MQWCFEGDFILRATIYFAFTVIHGPNQITKNAQNISKSSIELTKRTFIIIKSNSEFHSMFPVKHQKIVKRAREKKTVKALFHLFPPPIDWERAGEIEFFCHPCNAYWTLYALGWYIVVLLGDGDPNFTYAPSPSSCRWKALNGFFHSSFFRGSNNAGEYWTVH